MIISRIISRNFLLMAFISPFLLAGCAIGPEKENIATYTLKPSLEQAEGASNSRKKIHFREVRIAPQIQGQKIRILKHRRQMDFYADARWASDTDELIYSFVSQALEQYYGPLIPDHQNIPDKCLEITLKVRDFQAEYAKSTHEPPVIHISVLAILQSDKGPDLSPAHIIAHKARANKNTLGAVTKTFENVLEKISREIIKHVNKHPSC